MIRRNSFERRFRARLRGKPSLIPGVIAEEMLTGHGGTEFRPDQMSFGSVTSPGYFDPQPAGLIETTDNFASTSSWTNHGAGGFSVSGNVGTLTCTSATQAVLTNNSSPTWTVPNILVEITINDSGTAPSGGTFDNLYCGVWHSANGDALYAIIDRKNNLLIVQNFVGGVNHQPGQVAFTPTYPFKLGMGLLGNTVTVWVDAGSGWSQKATFSTTYDFTIDGNVSAYVPVVVIGNNGSGTATWHIKDFKSGRSGGGGIRDMRVVTNEDGTPYFSGSSVYFTATVHGSYTGVFTLNCSTFAIAQTGCIYVDDGTKTTGWLPAHIIYYSNGDRRITFGQFNSSATVGSFVVKSKLITSGSQPDILTANSSIVSGLTTLSLPLGSHSATETYDAMLAFDSPNSRWLCAYTLNNNNTTFWTALATATTLSGPWTLIGEDFSVAANPGYEGTTLIKINGLYNVMAGGRTLNRSYDATMTYLGPIPGVTITGSGNTQPWPMIFNDPDGAHQTLLTFDGVEYNSQNFTWGQPHIQKSARFV